MEYLEFVFKCQELQYFEELSALTLKKGENNKSKAGRVSHILLFNSYYNKLLQ